jgi:colicin import membrane protein
MQPAQFELQLKVWKELAISKQMMMRTAAEALKLDPECSPEELKAALETTLKRIAEADASVVAARDQARQSVATIEKRLELSQRAQAAAEASAADLTAKHKKMAEEMAIERTAFAKDLQQMKDRMAEKDKAIKAINTALADTPDNVLKKMKALKKEKQDEADARKRLEASFAALRKEKRDEDQQLKESQDNAEKLATQCRNLHALCTTLLEQLKPLVKDAKTLPTLPEIDTKLLETVEKAKDKKDKQPAPKEALTPP